MQYNRKELEKNFVMNEWIPFFELKEIKFFYKVSEVKGDTEFEYTVNIKSKETKDTTFVGYSNTVQFNGIQTNKDYMMYVYLLFESIIETQFNVTKSLTRILEASIGGNIRNSNKVILTNLKDAGYFQSHKNALYILDDELIIPFEEAKYKGSVIVFRVKYEKDLLVLKREFFICEKIDDISNSNVLIDYLIKNNLLEKNDELLLKLLSE